MTSSRRRIAIGLVLAAMAALLAALVALWWIPTTAQSIDRVERDHGITLPDSARNIQAMGDLIRFVDHGRSAVLAIDTTDLAEFTAQLDRIDDVGYVTFVPGNRQYQPRETPWPPDTSPVESFGKRSPVGGDFMHVEIYVVDPTTTGLWIYSDWN